MNPNQQDTPLYDDQEMSFDDFTSSLNDSSMYYSFNSDLIQFDVTQQILENNELLDQIAAKVTSRIENKLLEKARYAGLFLLRWFIVLTIIVLVHVAYY
jgi:hypothetical protein